MSSTVAAESPRVTKRGSPFPGLVPFGADDAAFFHGRERECELVADNLLAYPISVLFGPSGAGKSSLLRAGVLPALAHAEAGDRPLVCSDWADGPTACLRRALLGLDGVQANADAPLAELVAVGALAAPGPLLILLDQFEELLAGAGPDDELADAIAAAAPSAHVMIVIRDDALAQLDPLAGAVPDLFDHLVELRPLDADAARVAIEASIAAWNAASDDAVHATPALVSAVIEQVTTDDGRSINAPYLQLVMRRLWEAELGPERRTLDIDALVRQGGAAGIVSAHVNRAMDACTPRQQAVAAAMLDVLVTPSGAKVAQHSTDLAAYADVGEPEATSVLERLTTGERLLVPAGAARYQLAHDALAAPVLAWRERWRARLQRRRERRRLLAIMAFVALLLGLVTLFHGLDPLELATVDARFALRGTRPAPHDVLLVTIDDASLARLGVDWPVPRKLDGDAIDWIGDGRPRAIAYDVDFSGRRPDDSSLAEAIYGARRRVVVAAEATAPSGQVEVLGGNRVLEEIGARPGYSAFAPDLGGVIRHPLYAVDGVKSFALAAAETATRHPLAPDGVDDAWLDYYGPEGTLSSVPFWKVIRHRVPPSLFRDKVVVVGVTSPSIDRHPVWGTQEADMPGVEIQATAIDTLLRGLPLRSPPPVVTVALVLAFALLPALVSRWCSLAVTLAIALGVGALYLAVAAYAFGHGSVLPVVAPLAGLVLAAFAVLLVHVVPAEPHPSREVARP